MYNLNDYYFLNMELTGYAWIWVGFCFIIYNFLLVQFSPNIKKTFNKIFNKKSEFRGFTYESKERRKK